MSKRHLCHFVLNLMEQKLPFLHFELFLIASFALLFLVIILLLILFVYLFLLMFCLIFVVCMFVFFHRDLFSNSIFYLPANVFSNQKNLEYLYVTEVILITLNDI